jgi:hypothetical protein
VVQRSVGARTLGVGADTTFSLNPDTPPAQPFPKDGRKLFSRWTCITRFSDLPPRAGRRSLKQAVGFAACGRRSWAT